MMKKKIIILLVMFFACMCSSCANQSQDEETNQCIENECSYLTGTFTPELYDILFEKEPYEYEIKYSADYYLTMIEGHQDLIYYENFFIYEKDVDGNLTNCKTVMITKPELNQTYMEEYLIEAYGEDYKYEKPFENVYVHDEDIAH